MDKLKVLTAALALASVVLLSRWILGTSEWIGAKDLVGLLLFLVINVLAESKPLLIPGSKGSHAELTISGLSSYAIIALFPPLCAAVTGACAVLVTEALIKRKPFIKSSFNTCQTFLSFATASAVYALVLGHPMTTPPAEIVLATAAAVLGYFVTNTGLVTFATSLLHGTPFWRGWAGHHRWEIFYVACSFPLALLLILAYQRLWIAGPFLFIGPLFLLRESYAQHIRLKTNYTETVRTLVKVIETHDTYTAGHSLRVAEYAKRLGYAMRLPTKEVEKLEIAAYLHDLGKVHLSITDLVRKPGRLTPEERMRVQLHPIVSAELARQVTLFRGEIEAIIRYHHENHDGSGYPYGLSGDQIPLGARILHVVDAFDAMTSSRVYRNALDLEEVKAELSRCAGTHFAPEIVAAFLSAWAKEGAMVLEQTAPADGGSLDMMLQEALMSRHVHGRHAEPVLSYT